MATKFNMIRDINGFNGFGLIQSDTKYSGVLTQGVGQSITIPSVMAMGANGISTDSQWIALFYFQPGTSIWVSINGTAAFPTGAVSTSTSEGNPTARLVYGGNTISLITNTVGGAEFGVMLYAIS